jgi:deferrochelatase/peroxidase EfeB
VNGSTRRAVLATGAGAALAGAAAGLTYAARPASADGRAEPDAVDTGIVPFRGERQAGITTAAQDRLHLVALDVVTDDPEALRDLLSRWTVAAERMTFGAEAAPGGVVGGGPWKVPQDTGEAYDLAPGHLTVTIGYGASLFDERFGLADRRPEALRELPAFLGDDLDPARSGGDIVIQACSDDPQVAVHAVRNLVRLGFGVVAVRWSQLGFGRTSSTSQSQVTPRNMFGFKDGTANIKADEKDALTDWVWVARGDGPDWLVDGSYLVARSILMRIETWDREPLEGQEEIIGRTKGAGAPLSGGDEFTKIDLAATRDDGQPAIPMTAHIRLAHQSLHRGARLLRRGYTFVDGNDDLGQLAAGLFFLAYQRDPRTQFIPIQQALAASDVMNEYIQHVGSAVFACPPGVDEAGWWGQSLFA